jgi:hypothetical protein
MGKHSHRKFARRKNDNYPTPDDGRCVPTLLPHIGGVHFFAEPCAGRDRSLVKQLERAGKQCTFQADIEDDEPFDFFNLTEVELQGAEAIITNPPWTRDILHPFIEYCLTFDIPTYLLFDADWAHTQQAYDYLRHCVAIYSIGRVKWIPNSPHQGKDNAAWYRFEKRPSSGTRFYGIRPK